MKKCIICGKKESVKESVHDYDLPHGTISICTSSQCKKLLTYKINFAVPVVWFSLEDAYEEDGNDFLTKEEAEALTDEEIVDLGDEVSEDIGYGFSGHVESAVESWKMSREKEKIMNTPLKKLPLLIGSIEFNANKRHLEERLKKGK